MLQPVRNERARPANPATRRACIGLGTALLAAAGCASALGIDDAVCDSTYSAECDSVSGGNGGAANLAGSGGASGSGGSGGSGGRSAQGGDGGSAPTMAGSGGSAGPVEDPLCAQYCDLVAASCVEEREQYASRAACMAVCDLLEPGEPGDTSGNTVQCRLTRATLAATTGEPDNYCFSAGPGGAGTCGSDCEGYCTLMTAKCGDLGTRAQCLSACASVPDLSEPPRNERFNTEFQSGDSLQCRLFHVSAATLDPASHCVHAAGVAVCSATP